MQYDDPDHKPHSQNYFPTRSKAEYWCEENDVPFDFIRRETYHGDRRHRYMVPKLENVRSQMKIKDENERRRMQERISRLKKKDKCPEPPLEHVLLSIAVGFVIYNGGWWLYSKYATR